MKTNINLLLTMIIVCVCCCSCTWRSTDTIPLDFPRDMIWEVTYKAIDRHYDIESASEKEGELETEWHYNMSMMYLDGFRDKVYISLVEVDKTETTQDTIEEDTYAKYGIEKEPTDDLDKLESETDDQKEENEEDGKRYILKVTVETQQNRNAVNPSSKQQAEWWPNGWNRNEEKRIINEISIQLKTIRDYAEDEELSFVDE